MSNQIKVTANENRRTYTIRQQESGRTWAKYRTVRLSREEFEELQQNTSEDWLSFLRHEKGSYIRL